MIQRIRMLLLAVIALVIMGATPAQAKPITATASVVKCGKGDSSTAIKNAITYAAAHPTGVQGRSGASQGVVSIPYPNTCRIFGIALKSNVRLVIDSGVVIKQYGNQSGSLFSLAGVNSSILLGDPSHGSGDRAGHWIVNADAKQTGGNPDIHPINMTGSYLEVTGPYLIGNWGEASVSPSQSHYKTTSGMIHFGGPSYVWLSNAVGMHQPGGYGLTEVSNGNHLTFDHLYSQGGVALRLETNPCKSTLGTDTVTASDITGVDGNTAVNLSAHNLSVTNVTVTGVTARNEAHGVHITNAGGNCESGGGTVTGSVSTGCIYSGSSAQIMNGDDTWTLGQSLTAVDKAGPAPANLHVTVTGVGASGTFKYGPGLIDPTVRC